MRAPRANRRAGARPRVRALAALAALAALGAAPAAQEDPDEALRSQPFALPLARDARTLAERARDHVQARRWSEALADLQRLVEEHSSDVLPPQWRASERPSIYAAHPGAGAWARATLEGLPQDARKLYRERYEPQARQALERARADRSRRALTEVARRFPLTRSAGLAWWALGDVELERGHADDARLSFARARAVLAETDGAAPDALERRDASAAGQPSPERAGTTALSPVAGGSLPRGESDRWPSAYALAPDPLEDDGVMDAYSLFPALDGDRVLVGTAYQVVALDAFTGALEWQAGPPRGWSSLSRQQRNDLGEAIAHGDLLLAPAVGSGVVVAALQIPYSINPSDKWQGIEIMEAIPERRLYAFDERTGRELWSHEPPLSWNSSQSRFTWDESQGTYAQRMLVAAPPVLAGARLLVPCYRMSGRIEYHLACYEVETGERLWSTPLVSGQRETNMFGRAGKEFVASPVAVAGGLVVAQTELGAVAGLDLLTGEIEWESLYEQIPLPKTFNYNPNPRNPTWRVTPPRVAGGVVLCTPHDSPHLVAFVLEDGCVPWSMSQRAHLPRARGGADEPFDLLLGAEGDTLYLAGESVAALRKPGGLDAPGSRFEQLWTFPLPSERILATPRPVLCRDEIVIPQRDGSIVLDRETGAQMRLKAASWGFQENGNPLVGDGRLYTLNRGALTGFFDWEALLERARLRLREQPGDAEAIVAAAELFLRRGLALSEAGEPGRALAVLGEARRLLEPQREGGVDRDLDRRLFRVLCSEAAASTALAATAEALAALDAARPLAPDRGALCDVLLREERLLRGRDEARRGALLEELERTCADLPLPPETLREGPGWLIGEALLEPGDLEGWEDAGLPVGLWVLLDRADAAARAFDRQRALEDLHAALARYGDLHVNAATRVADVVDQRLARRLSLDGRGVYASFEARAQELLRRALETRDEATLAGLVRLYPHAEAAIAARRTLLDWSFAAGDTARTVALAWALVQDAPRAGGEEALGLLRAATLLGRAGNHELEALLVEALASDQPDLRSDLPGDEGRALSELAALRSAADDGWRTPHPCFDASVRPAGSVSGINRYLGRLRVPGTSDDPDGALADVYLGHERLRAFSSDAPSELLWQPFELPSSDPDRIALSAERVVAGVRHTLLAIGADGEQAWQTELEGLALELSVGSGLALVLSGPRQGPDRLLAFDVQGGLPLWELPLPAAGSGEWRPPLVAGRHAVLFLQRTNQPAGVLVVDLARGRATASFDLVVSVTPHIQRQAWVSGGTLFVPSFRRRPDEATLFAYALDTGSALWSLPLPRDESLAATIGCQGRDYLVTEGVELEAEGGGGLYLLEDPANGFFRQVLRFRRGERVIGGSSARRLELEEPLLFLEGDSADGATTSVRAVTLPFGSGWTHALPLPSGEGSGGALPLPAVSSDVVVLACVRRNEKRGNDGVRLVFLDRMTGIPLDRRDLDVAGVHSVELHALGDALFVLMNGRAGAVRMDILETPR